MSLTTTVAVEYKEGAAACGGNQDSGSRRSRVLTGGSVSRGATESQSTGQRRGARRASTFVNATDLLLREDQHAITRGDVRGNGARGARESVRPGRWPVLATLRIGSDVLDLVEMGAGDHRASLRARVLCES